MRNCFVLMVAIGLSLFVATVAHADLFMSVSGKVVAADNGAGLGNIKLVLMSPAKGPISETRSNAQGVFVLRDVPIGSYEIVTISEDPFVVSSNTAVPVSVPDGKNVVGIGIKLQRGGIIKGRVVTDFGDPVPQTSVICDGSSVTTGQDGTFSLKGISAGPAKVALIAAGLGSKTISVVSEIGKITEAGDVTYKVGPETSLIGSIVDSNGVSIPNAIIVAYNSNGSSSYTTTSDNGNFFFLGLDAGLKYKITVVSYGYETATLSDVAVPFSNLRIELNAAATTTVGMYKYRFNNDVEAFYQDITPAASAVKTCSKGNCPDGNWGGVSLDISFLVPVGIVTQYGWSFSVGAYACFNSSDRLIFTSFCKYYGASTSLFSATAGASIGYCSACCTENLLGDSNGVQIGANVATTIAISVAWDIGSSKCIWFSPSFSVPTIPSPAAKKNLSDSRFYEIFSDLYNIQYKGTKLKGLLGISRSCTTVELDYRYAISYWINKLDWLRSKLI